MTKGNILSAPDIEIIQHTANGLKDREICIAMKYANRSVDAMKYRMFKALKIRSSAELVAYGFRNNLIK